MTLEKEPYAPAAPAPGALARTTGIALVVAAVLLITIVLPAEYAIDLVGTGRWLGLTRIAAPTIRPAETGGPGERPLSPVQKGPVGEYGLPFSFDVYEIALGPYEYVEYKYQMQQGASMLYAWNASAPVVHDFHGERASGGAPAEETFDKQDRRQANGSFVAPFAGIHGWYWENPGSEPIKIRLTSSGFYSSAVEIRSDRTRRTRTLRQLDTLTQDTTGDPR